MKKIELSLFFCLITTLSFSQITKGNWLVGGTGRFSTQSEKLNNSDVNSLLIQLSPNLGYFFANKVAVGLKPEFSYTQFKYSGTENHAIALGVGPFVRYYLLPTDNRINILTEGSYEYLSDLNGYHQNIFTATAGPVIYFNSSVGLEATLNYETFKSGSGKTSAKTFFLAVGFQIHLEKEKN
jgi:hypothetical protein